MRSVRAASGGGGGGGGGGVAEAEAEAAGMLALQLDLDDQPPAAIVGAPRLLVGASPRLVARPLRPGEQATLGAVGAGEAEAEEEEEEVVEFGWARK